MGAFASLTTPSDRPGTLSQRFEGTMGIPSRNPGGVSAAKSTFFKQINPTINEEPEKEEKKEKQNVPKIGLSSFRKFDSTIP